MDWDLILKMRQGFLETAGHLPDYWHDERWLQAYEQTLAQRISWKWLAVLDKLDQSWRNIQAPTLILDWGCGTGIAARSFLRQWPNPEAKVSLYDRSSEAARFAAKMMKLEHPQVQVEVLRKPAPPNEAFILLVSHVLSELDDKTREQLHDLAQNAAAVIWVEPGRSLESRRLSSIRDRLSKNQRILGPCLHAKSCGVMQPSRESDWCHFFAPVPADVHHSAFWREFSKRMKVDLRSLPVAWLATVQKVAEEKSVGSQDSALILSRPQVFKGYCRWLACTEAGVCSGVFQKKHSKEIYESLRSAEFMTHIPKNQLIRNQDASL